MNGLGIITPDIVRSLGYISDEAQRSLGIITPDITRSLGSPQVVAGAPIAVWTSVLSMSTVGSMAAGFVATRSPRTAAVCAIGGLVGGAAGVLLAARLLQKRAEEEEQAAQQIPEQDKLVA